MIGLTATFSVIVFIFSLSISGLVPTALHVLDTVRNSVVIIRDASLNDERREKDLQRASLYLFGLFFSVLIRGVLVLFASFLPICLASLFGLTEIGDVIRYISQGDFLVITTIIVCVTSAGWARLKPASHNVFHVNHSTFDRLLHRVAFSTRSIQLTAADIEKKVYGRAYETVEVRRPILITSLPGAGTTLFLEVLHRFPSLATHTYRDMPFIMAPLLWAAMSSSYYKPDKILVRPDGDGIKIRYGSPEAFEEIIWRTLWPQKYNDANIELWDYDDRRDEATSFFVEHMKKMIVLRRPDRKHDGRYLSKNNSNIARLDLIGRMFPEAKILIPVRHPVEHALSMFRQHLHFIEIHKKEPYVCRYMSDIGHYEFGILHRPIAFPGIARYIRGRNPLTLDYWLGYWIAAYEHILELRESVTIVSYEHFCSMGRSALSEICWKLEIPEEDVLESAASIIKAPPPPRGDKHDYDSKLVYYAEDLYETLINEQNMQ